jgi:hypothetical protein
MLFIYFCVDKVFKVLKSTVDTYVDIVNALQNTSKHVAIKRNAIELYGRNPSKRATVTKNLLKKRTKTVQFREQNVPHTVTLQQVPPAQLDTHEPVSSNVSTVSYSMFKRNTDVNNSAKLVEKDLSGDEDDEDNEPATTIVNKPKTATAVRRGRIIDDDDDE